MDGDTAVAPQPTAWTGFTIDEYPGYSKVVGPVDLDELKARLRAGERILWDDNDTVPTADELKHGSRWVQERAAKRCQVRKWRKVSWPALQYSLGKRKLLAFNSYWGAVEDKARPIGYHQQTGKRAYAMVSELTMRLRKAGRKAAQLEHKCALVGEAAERSAKPPTPPLATMEKPTVLTE